MDQLTPLFLEGYSLTEIDTLERKQNRNPYAFIQIKFDGDEP